MKLNHFVCPWRAGPILTSSIRRTFHNPQHILSPFCLTNGMKIMDIGCGMGFFTLPMSDLVGSSGNVIAVDMQEKMLGGLKKNALKIGANNITPHQCDQASLHVEQWNGIIDFVLVFYMLHEVPDPKRLIRELHAAMSPEGKLLFVEPFIHVTNTNFQNSIKMITESGFTAVDEPKIPISRSTLFTVK